MEIDSIDDLEDPTLHDILDFRETTYQSLTETALAPFQSKLSEAAAFFLDTNAPTTWTSIETVTGLVGFVTISGYVSPKIGSRVKLGEDDFVEATAENSHMYRSKIRFIVPIKLLETGTKLQLLTFIRELSTIASLVSEQELEQMLKEFYFDDMTSLTSHATYNRMLEQATRPRDVMGFDGTILSDEQITKAHLYSGASTETKN